MTLEQGWLHALILAHLVQQSRGYSPGNAAHWALVRVRRPEIAAITAPPLYATPIEAAISALLRSIHRDAWAS